MIDPNFPQRLLKHVLENANRGDVDNIINVMDNYCYTVERCIAVGDKKGKILDSCMMGTDPKIALELGTYFGYSALRIARLLGEDGTLYTVEANSAYADVARKIIKFANLEGKIRIIVGQSSDVIPELSKKFQIFHLDFLFIDHWKSCYKPDIFMLEELGFLKDGTVILADNTFDDECQDYVEYVRQSPKYQCTAFQEKDFYTNNDDGMEKSVFKI